MENAKQTLDEAVYGMDDAKCKYATCWTMDK